MTATPPRRVSTPFEMSSARKSDGTAESEKLLARRIAESEMRLLEMAQRDKQKPAGTTATALPPMRPPEPTPEVVGGTVPRADYEHLRRELVEAERRYQQEKRELLSLRANQLQHETSKRTQEGDLIARAMQVMSEFEMVVRSSEESSMARLSQQMRQFEEDWLRRTKEFEEHKASFESEVMSKAMLLLRNHSDDIKAIGMRITQDTLSAIEAQNASRLSIEEEVLRQSEEYKVHYKKMIDEQFARRCREYDDALEEREKNIVQLFQREKAHIIEIERKAIAENKDAQIKALTEAMEDLTLFRDRIVEAYHAQQKSGVEELFKRRAILEQEHNDMVVRSNEHIAHVERECAAIVESSQKAVTDAQLRIAEVEAELTKKMISQEAEREASRQKELVATREGVEAHWRAALEEARRRHTLEKESLTSDMHSRIEAAYAEQDKREQELQNLANLRISRAEEACESRWSTRLQDLQQKIERQGDIIAALREENQRLAAQHATVQQQLQLREGDVALRVAAAQRDVDQAWQRKAEEMRARFDRLLNEALGGPGGDAVSRIDHQRVVEQLQAMEERCAKLRAGEAERIAEERAQLNDLWRRRLDQERAERAPWEEEQLRRVGEMRAEILADARKKEAEAMRRVEVERASLHDSLTKRGIAERQDREAFEERVREEARARIREAEQQQEEIIAERSRVYERRMRERELDLERKMKELKDDARRLEETAKREAAEWLNRQKDEILADVKSFHETLQQQKDDLEKEKFDIERTVELRYLHRFDEAKAQLLASTQSFLHTHLDSLAVAESHWLSFREEEMRLVFESRGTFEGSLLTLTQRSFAQARQEAEDLLRAERELLDRREMSLQKELATARAEMENVARTRAVRLLEERNHLQEESDRARAAEEAKMWEQLELRVLDKEKRAEAERRIIELELRTKYEGLVAGERQKVAQLIDQLSDEARRQYLLQEDASRKRMEEWARQRIAMEREDSLARHTYNQQLRGEYETKLNEERMRYEEALKRRDEVHNAERQRLMDAVEGRFRDHEASMKTLMSTLRDEYDVRLKQLQQDASHHRQMYLADLAEQHQKMQTALSAHDGEAIKKIEKEAAMMRSNMEHLVSQQAQREKELRERIEREKSQFEEHLRSEYEAILKTTNARVARIAQDAMETSLRVEQDNQEQLLRLQREMESSIQRIFSGAEQQQSSQLEEARAMFKSKMEEAHTSLRDERQRRFAAEKKSQQLEIEMSSLRGSIEEHKHAAYVELQQRFEALLTDVRERSYQEKETALRAAVEMEEQRLARDIAKRGMSPKPSTHVDVVELQPSFDRPATPTTTKGGEAAGKLLMATIAKKRERLLQLWHVLDTPEEEQRLVFEALADAPPQRRLERIEEEIHRAELALPLLEVITRRDFVIHRIRELQRSGNTGRTLSDLTHELERLNEQLLRDIPQFEATHRMPLMIKGERFLTVLQESVQAPPNWSARK